jgi:hypothetical protein
LSLLVRALIFELVSKVKIIIQDPEIGKQMKIKKKMFQRLNKLFNQLKKLLKLILVFNPLLERRIF